VRRDIDRLREIGYPVEASAGGRGGYRLTAGAAMPLCRLCYAGYASIWGFAIYRASHDDYQDNHLPSGQPSGTPEEAAPARPEPVPPRGIGQHHHPPASYCTTAENRHTNQESSL